MLDTPGQVHPVAPGCTRAVEATASTLEQLGAAVEIAHPAALDELEYLTHGAKIIPFAYAAFAVDWWKRRTGVELGPDDVEPWTWACVEIGRKISAAEYLSAVEFIQAWTRRLTRWWHDEYDLLVTPTVPEPPPVLGTFEEPGNAFRAGVRGAEITPFTFPFNASGQPAISLPGHFDDGLPIGVQLVAAHGQEKLLLEVARDLEEAEKWNLAPPMTQGFDG